MNVKISEAHPKERRDVFIGKNRARNVNEGWLRRRRVAKMAKTLLSMPDLRRKALAEIRQQPGCHNVQDITINRVSNRRAESNWSLCVLSAGAADANTAARAAVYVQSVLRRDYDLTTD